MGIQGEIAVLDTKLEQQIDYQANAEQLCAAISEYLHIDKLTPFILNKLVERIDVGHTEMVDGQPQQEVTILWKGCLRQKYVKPPFGGLRRGGLAGLGFSFVLLFASYLR